MQQVAGGKQHQRQNRAAQIEIMPGAVLQSPAHAGEKMQALAEVSENYQ